LAPDIIFENAKLPDGRQVNIRVTGGRFTAFEETPIPGTPSSAREDLSGRLVLPGFIDGHIHLDTSFIGDEWKPHKPCTAGFDVRERVAFQRENMAAAKTMAERAAALIEFCLAKGTTSMRSHVNVDAAVGLKHFETIIAAREKYRDLIDIELVAFPQNGVVSCSGTEELLDYAIANGCELIGGLDPATIDRNIEKQLDIVFGIAEKHGVDVDIHLHDAGTLGVYQIEQIAHRTIALGMQGHVAVSHAYALGEIPLEAVRRTADLLAKAGVSIMTNAPGAHAFPPVSELAKAGVTVFSGNDNIRDSWWPYGDGDMLGRAMIVGYRSGFYTDETLSLAFDMISSNAAKAMRLDDYGLRVGAKADFVVLNAAHIPEAVASVPHDRAVYKEGRRVADRGVILKN
jgi:cytosine/creatinine deaminase